MMGIKLRAVLLALVGLLAGLSVHAAAATVSRTEDALPKEIWAEYHAKGARAAYVVKAQDGLVAVYRSGARSAEKLTDIETAVLRRSDRAMLERGIPAENIGEVLQLLEDLGS